MFRIFVTLLLAVSLAAAPGIASTAVDCTMAEMPVMSASPEMQDQMADENDEMECSLQCDFACSATAFLNGDGKKYGSYAVVPPAGAVAQDTFKSADRDGIDPPPRA